MHLSNADILKLVPEFMRQDGAVKGLSTAVNKLIKEPAEKVKTLRVWDKIDELDDAQLDELAYELNIDWYNSALPIESKRAIVKTSDLVHSRRGTKWAVEEVIKSYFSSGFVVEWHEDGYINPKPFHFSVYTGYRNVTDKLLQEFFTIAKIAMSVRSRIDGVYFSDTYSNRVVVSNSESVFFFTPKKCGTIPKIATVGEIVTTAATATVKGSSGSVVLTKCGTSKCG